MTDYFYLIAYILALNFFAAVICLLVIGGMELSFLRCVILGGAGCGARLIGWAWYYREPLNLLN